MKQLSVSNLQHSSLPLKTKNDEGAATSCAQLLTATWKTCYCSLVRKLQTIVTKFFDDLIVLKTLGWTLKCKKKLFNLLKDSKFSFQCFSLFSGLFLAVYWCLPNLCQICTSTGFKESVSNLYTYGLVNLYQICASTGFTESVNLLGQSVEAASVSICGSICNLSGTWKSVNPWGSSAGARVSSLQGNLWSTGDRCSYICHLRVQILRFTGAEHLRCTKPVQRWRFGRLTDN